LVNDIEIEADDLLDSVGMFAKDIAYRRTKLACRKNYTVIFGAALGRYMD
jgi:hypothetical protein